MLISVKRVLLTILTFVIKFGVAICYIGIIIWGFVLSKRRDNVSIPKKIAAVAIPIVAYLIEFVGLRYVNINTVTLFYIITMIMYVLGFVAMVLSLYLLAGYKPSRWVIVTFAVLAVVYLLRTIYFGKIFYGLGSLININSEQAFLMSFMNNGKALDVINALCMFIPAITLVVDSNTTISKR